MICKNFSESDRLLMVEKLSFQLQQQPILQNISFHVPQGQLTVLIGPNGAGKSTLMRILSGYVKAQGHCEFNQKALSEYSPVELAQQRAVMRQHSQLNFPFSDRKSVV